VVDNGTGASVRRDINVHLLAIATNNSGPVEPATPYPGQLWLDTSYGVNGFVKLRDQANSAWIELFDADAGGFYPKSGGEITGEVIVKDPNGWSGVKLQNTATGNEVWLHGMGTSLETVNEFRLAFITQAMKDAGLDRGVIGSPFVFNMQTGVATATGDWVTTSDRRVKENIRAIPDALERVLAMAGVFFTRKDTAIPGAGVIAQDIEKVAPELVTETDGIKGVNYGGLGGYFIEAIRVLNERIESLEAQLKDAKA
jgi:hypothetical protein